MDAKYQAALSKVTSKNGAAESETKASTDQDISAMK